MHKLLFLQDRKRLARPHPPASVVLFVAPPHYNRPPHPHTPPNKLRTCCLLKVQCGGAPNSRRFCQRGTQTPCTEMESSPKDPHSSGASSGTPSLWLAWAPCSSCSLTTFQHRSNRGLVVHPQAAHLPPRMRHAHRTHHRRRHRLGTATVVAGFWEITSQPATRPPRQHPPWPTSLFPRDVAARSAKT